MSYTRKELATVAEIAARWWTDRLFDGEGFGALSRTPTKEECELFYDLLQPRIEDLLVSCSTGALIPTMMLNEVVREVGLLTDHLSHKLTMKVAGDLVIVGGKVLFGVAPKVQPSVTGNVGTWTLSGNHGSVTATRNNNLVTGE